MQLESDATSERRMMSGELDGENERVWCEEVKKFCVAVAETFFIGSANR